MDYHTNVKKERPPRKEKLEISTGTLRKILYIGELPPNTDQYQLYQMIHAKGQFTIDSIITKNTIDNKSYAYVKFGNEREALKAKEILHLSNVNGYVIRANIYNKHLNIAENNNGTLFVKNLPTDLTSKDLCDLFQEVGEIASIKMSTGLRGECLGKGYVQYSNEKDAETALEKLNGYILKGRKIIVERFSDKKERNKDDDKQAFLYFRELPSSITNEGELEKVISQYGKVVFSFVYSNETETGSHAVVIFENFKEGKNCLEHLNDTSLPGTDGNFKLTFSPTEEERKNYFKAKKDILKKKFMNCNLIVKNVPKEMDDSEFFHLFREFGDITRAQIQREDGKFVTRRDDKGNVIDKEFIYESKGFGFVCYKKQDSAELAISSLHGKNLKGKYQDVRLNVEYYNYDRSENKESQQNNNANRNNRNDFNQNEVANNNHHYNSKPNSQYKHNYGNNYNNQGGYKKKFHNKKNFNNNYNTQQNNPSGNNYYNNDDGSQNYYSNPGQGMNQPYMMPMKNFNQQVNNYSNNMNRNFRQQPYLNNPQSQIPVKKENPFMTELLKIMRSTDENRNETMGEIIFYYLRDLIQSHKLNTTGVDDDRLCSKFTGIFLNSPESQILNIFKYEEALIKTLQELVGELTKDPSFLNK